MQIAAMMSELVSLEGQVATAAKAANAADELRVYEWRPHGFPQLPAIWNWIDDGSFEIADTARGDDILVITVTIAVRPADIDETIGRLVRITDIFRRIVDPALWINQPLGGTAKRAKRVVTRTEIYEYDQAPVMAMDMLIRVELPQIIEAFP